MLKLDTQDLIYTFRGIVGKALTAQKAFEIGLIASESIGRGEFAYIGADHRHSTQMLKYAVGAGLMSGGVHLYDCGLLPTPVLSRVAARHKANGLMITASHNPSEWNGFQFFEKDSHIFGPEWENKIKMRIGNPPAEVDAESTGTVKEFHGAISEYTKEILDQDRHIRKLRVLIDYGHGTAGTVIPQLLDNLGIDVVGWRSSIDAKFLNSLYKRISQASQFTLADICEAVAGSDVDFGIAYDGDADRLVVVDDRGRYVDGDVLIAVLARNCFSPGETVIVTADTSMIVEQTLKPLGYRVLPCRVGQTFLGDLARESKAVFVGEPNGHYMFPEYSLHGDAVRATVLLMEALTTEGSSLSEIVDRFPQTSITRMQLEIERDLAEYEARICRHLQKNFGSCQKLHDRLFVGKNDVAKAVFRQSPFDATVRIFAESYEKGESEYMISEMKAVLSD